MTASFIFILAAVGCTSISKKQELDKAVAEIGDCTTNKAQGTSYSEMDIRTKKSRCLETYLDTGKACWEHVVKVVYY